MFTHQHINWLGDLLLLPVNGIGLNPINFTKDNLKTIEKSNKTLFAGYINDNKLPEHPLIKKGYKSIGCIPCTSKVADDEPQRSGRWNNKKKTECGIHTYNPLI